jgi:hypothetical protein
MPSDLSTSPFLLAAIVLALLGAVLLLTGLAALLRARPMAFATRTLCGLLLISLGALAATIAFGTQGYRALTHEALAARLTVHPLGPQRFSAAVHFVDGRQATFELAGDEIYVDAHILKWKPIANLFGLHTAYELDRIAGRYRGIGDERNALRTVHALAPDRPVDVFRLRQRHAFLSAVVDAEYGSATFVAVTRPTAFELRVSSTGLLMREAPVETK